MKFFFLIINYNMANSSVVTGEVTVAQLCLDTTAINVNDVYTIHIFDKGNANTNAVSAGVGVAITVAQFEEAFYGSSTNAAAAFTALASADAASAFYSLSGGVYTQHGKTAGTAVDYTDEIINLWAKDCGSKDRWSTCSYLAIRKELMDSHNFKDLANCNVCCSLCYGDVVAALNHENGTTASALAANDKLSISILIKNSYPGTEDVEVLIHYTLAA